MVLLRPSWLFIVIKLWCPLTRTHADDHISEWYLSDTSIMMSYDVAQSLYWHGEFYNVIPYFPQFPDGHGCKRWSQVCLPCIQAFLQYVSGRYLTFYCSSAFSFDSIKSSVLNSGSCNWKKTATGLDQTARNQTTVASSGSSDSDAEVQWYGVKLPMHGWDQFSVLFLQ